MTHPAPGICYETDGPVAIITIDRPGARNALNHAAETELADAVQRMAADTTIKVGVLTGANGTFCAGADLSEMAVKGGGYKPWAGADGPLSNRPAKPLIAAVEGYAVAGGLGVALWADMRVASETAVFGVFCRRFGVPMSDGTPTRLPRVVGQGRALDMLLTGRPIHAEEALQMGLANRVVPEGQALEATIALAHQIAGFPPLAMLADRQAALEAFDQPEPIALVNEAEGAYAAKTEEAQAGAARFTTGTGRHGDFDGG
jgi:enoyl-CoA hydratase